MSMSKEELIEMIDSTINENGQRNITGKSLNLVLSAIVAAIESGNNCYDVMYFCGGNETDEQKEHNAMVFNKMKTLAEANFPLTPIIVDTSSYVTDSMGAPVSAMEISSALHFDTTGAQSEGVPTLIIDTWNYSYLVSSDGSMVTDF
jgi:hypothetical protein